MQNTMANYYNLLQFLRHIHIDRQYPLSFLEDDITCSSNGGTLTTECTSTHDKSYKFVDIDNVSFTIPIRKYDTCDYVDVDIQLSSEIQTSDITLALSESKHGLPISKELKCANNVTLSPNKINRIRFPIKNTATSLNTKTKSMGNVANISLKFPKIIESIYIADLVFREDNYNLTLEDLDYNIQSGLDHVKARLKLNYVPDELNFLIYKSAGAYSWLTIWQNEGKAMDDGDENSKNYYNRLLEDVDNIIDSWIDANPSVTNDSDINMNLVGYVPRASNIPQKPPRGASLRKRYL